MNLETRLRSTGARLLSSNGFRSMARRRARLKRRLSGSKAEIHYFHQVDDPYSQLAVQKLDELKRAYSLPFQVHLCSQPAADFLGSSEHFDSWALRDAASIASGYGLQFPDDPMLPDGNAVQAANDLLAAHLTGENFASIATRVGAALWTGASADQLDAHDSGNADGAGAVAAGNTLRQKLGHYAGGHVLFRGRVVLGCRPAAAARRAAPDRRSSARGARRCACPSRPQPKLPHWTPARFCSSTFLRCAAPTPP